MTSIGSRRSLDKKPNRINDDFEEKDAERQGK